MSSVPHSSGILRMNLKWSITSPISLEYGRNGAQPLRYTYNNAELGTMLGWELHLKKGEKNVHQKPQLWNCTLILIRFFIKVKLKTKHDISWLCALPSNIAPPLRATSLTHPGPNLGKAHMIHIMFPGWILRLCCTWSHLAPGLSAASPSNMDESMRNYN